VPDLCLQDSHRKVKEHGIPRNPAEYIEDAAQFGDFAFFSFSICAYYSTFLLSWLALCTLVTEYWSGAEAMS
jgi:hypothetical protein